MSLHEGMRLGPYEVLGPLGAGGMGEVYRASDTKLNREVALKVLPAAVAEEAGRLARFQREAQLLASLNHPNIAAIYGVEESGGAPALVMELAEGLTLAERIARGAVPLEDALGLARQLCDALEAAHAKGIIHRDLKPANIKITPEGQVKVLDFGLAKALEGDEAAAAASATMSPTLTIASTRAGVILGTAAYMSPEQARGLPADKRADIWAFGVVLYEMLTGRTTFAGETVSDTLAAVLKTDPDFALLPAETPPAIRRLLGRCLERDRRKRLHDIADARLELDTIDEAASAAVATPAARRWPWLPWAALAAIPLAAAAGWLLHRPAKAPSLPVSFSVSSPTEGRLDNMLFGLSPDGRTLALTIRSEGPASVWVRDTASGSARELPGTSRGSFAFWSADSRFVVILADDKLKRVDLAGGPAQTICDAPGFRGGSWNAAGVILFGMTGSPVMRVPASGGVPVPATTLDKAADARAHVFPHFLPDGNRFLYRANAGGKRAIMMGQLDGRKPPRPILEADSQTLFAPDPEGGGLLLFARGSVLMGARFNPDSDAPPAEPFPIVENIPLSSNGRLAASVSQDSRLLAVNDLRSAVGNPDLAMFDRAGKRFATLVPAAARGSSWFHVELSPDGSRLLGNRADGAGSDLWSLDIKRGISSRLTSAPEPDGPAVWSGDGRRIYYFSGLGGVDGLYALDAEGGGKPQLIHKAELHHLHASPDGRFVAWEVAPSTGLATSIAVLPLAKGGTPETVVQEETVVANPQFSPDGRWLAFTSTKTGRNEVYVQSHPPGKGRWQISRDGGSQPRWRRDGREIIFRSERGLHAVAVKPGADRLDFEAPILLFRERLASGAASYFAISGDAQRIVVNVRPEVEGEQFITVKLDWMPAVKR
jgi:eukaryotic-like serine/threonine-protein kinase